MVIRKDIFLNFYLEQPIFYVDCLLCISERHSGILLQFRFDQTIPTFLEDAVIDLIVQSQDMELWSNCILSSTTDMQNRLEALIGYPDAILLLKNNVYAVLLHL